jgi:hypothetical protein
MAAARLTLNTALPEIRELADGTSKSSEPLLRIIRWDVTRQLVMHALAWDEVSDAPADHESTTVSGVLRSLLARVWPLENPSALRLRSRLNPDLIEMQLQHHARILAD